MFVTVFTKGYVPNNGRVHDLASRLEANSEDCTLIGLGRGHHTTAINISPVEKMVMAGLLVLVAVAVAASIARRRDRDLGHA